MNVIDEVIAQIKMTQPIKMVGCAEGEFVPLNRVLALLEMASEREKLILAHRVSKTLNDLLLSIQRELNGRDPDQRRSLTMEDVTSAFLRKISDVNGAV